MEKKLKIINDRSITSHRILENGSVLFEGGFIIVVSDKMMRSGQIL